MEGGREEGRKERKEERREGRQALEQFGKDADFGKGAEGRRGE